MDRAVTLKRRRGVDVREIIAAGGIASRFQPIVQLSDGHVVAHEALSRGPGGTALECPRRLFDTADREGCGSLLDSACRAAALRRAAEAGWGGSAGGPLFLNVHTGALADPGFLPDLERTVADAGIRAGDVVLEVSEAERVGGDPVLHARLAACRAAGFWIALDDAGAGHCGLQAIVEVVPDVVKIDRALVGGMDAHRGRRAAVAALARLARELGIVLVAEGIETEGELRAVRAVGVPLGQRFLLGRPADAPLAPGSVIPAAARRPVGEPVAPGSTRMRRPGRRRGLSPTR
jgi:EAL domain-containing protein (putative c-di-GMP-specific phosphodiesterase class I)